MRQAKQTRTAILEPCGDQGSDTVFQVRSFAERRPAGASSGFSPPDRLQKALAH
ncbi:MAG: hypothetical protein JWN03_6510 [Nocardia sp.]|nr:hypothetical protein [Nocardia sp.]